MLLTEWIGLVHLTTKLASFPSKQRGKMIPLRSEI